MPADGARGARRFPSARGAAALLAAHRGRSASAPRTRWQPSGAPPISDLVETDLRPTATARSSVFTTRRFRGRGGSHGREDVAAGSQEPSGCLRPESGRTSARRAAGGPSSDVGLALELKSDRFLEPDTGRRLGELLRSFGVLDRTAVLSFDFARCRAVRREVPGLRTGVITLTGRLPAEGEAEIVGPAWPLSDLSPPRRVHCRGLVAPLDENPDRLWYYRAIAATPSRRTTLPRPSGLGRPALTARPGGRTRRSGRGGKPTRAMVVVQAGDGRRSRWRRPCRRRLPSVHTDDVPRAGRVFPGPAGV
jgi:hypothetical protein